MRLVPIQVPTWPKLAWVARVEAGTDQVRVYHGPMVETADEWVVEAVWAGEFAAGDFDQTDLVFGSGVRLRGENLLFVSAGTTLDRLCYCKKGSNWFVSNSLPGLLAATELHLRDDWGGYVGVLRTICKGLQAYQRTIPTVGPEVCLAYFNNLVFAKDKIREEDKPDSAPSFASFAEYYAYLLSVADRLRENMRSPERQYPILPLTTISSGYDSSAASVLARRAGCTRAVTIRQSTSIWRGSDSGGKVARRLGLRCSTHPRTSQAYPHEESIWAVASSPGILNWTLLGYPEALCLFFTGCHGDKTWGMSRAPVGDPYEIPSVADLGIGEFRLLQGVFHCPVPHWGMRHLHEIRSISFSEEMEPWRLGTAYDRPIPRRILEEEGVPRGFFGSRKKNTSLETSFRWPYSPEARESFAQYLSERGIEPPSSVGLWLRRRLCHLDNLFYLNVARHLGFDLGLRRRLQHPGCSLIFQWANHELKKRYEQGLREAGLLPLPGMHRTGSTAGAARPPATDEQASSKVSLR